MMTKYKRYLLISLIAVVALLLFKADAFAQGNVAGEVLVVFKPRTSFKASQRIVRKAGASSIRNLKLKNIRVKLLKVDPGAEEKTIGNLLKSPKVRTASRNHIIRMAWVPNDPYYAQGALNSLQWNFGLLNTGIAWEFARGNGTTVAVLDTGLAKNLSDINYANVLAGYDFVNGDKDPKDDNGHGTHVTGTIAAATNNAVGTAGIAPEAKILPVKVLNNKGEGTDITLINGLLYAYQKANIINLSMSLDGSSSVLKTIIDAIASEGIPVVAAAGNDAKAEVAYPARYDSAISVAATNYSNTIASYSNYGTGLDISAPGGDTTHDLNQDGYVDGILQEALPTQEAVAGPSSSFYFYDGTSMATAHISGIAALLYSQGVRGSSHIKSAITNTATDLGASGYDTTYGYGLADAASALIFQKSAVTMNVSKTRIAYGQAVKISGSLLPAQAASLFVQTYDDVKGKWSTVKTIASKDDGTYSTNLKVARNSYVRVDWNGTATVLGQTSAARAVSSKAQISLKRSAKRIKAGGSVILTGKVNPRHRGSIISIQQKVGKRWKTIAKARLNKKSLYKTRLKVNQKGLKRLRAYINHEHHLPTASKPVGIRVL